MFHTFNDCQAFFHVLPPQTSARMAWSFEVLSWSFCAPSLSGFWKRHQSDLQKHLKESLADFNVLLSPLLLKSARMCYAKSKHDPSCVYAPVLSASDCSLLNPNPLSYESSANLDLMNMTLWASSLVRRDDDEVERKREREKDWERERGREKNFPIKKLSKKGTLSDANTCTQGQECTYSTNSQLHDGLVVPWQCKKKKEIGGYTICLPACVCIAYA